jgi:hypothetical protein
MVLLSKQLVVHEGSAELHAGLGTPGLGKGSFAWIFPLTVAKDVHPVAQITFPLGASTEQPKHAITVLAQRC